MKLLYNEILFWDGSVYSRYDSNRVVESFSGNKKDCDVVQYIFQNVSGKKCSLCKDKRKYVNGDIYSVKINEKSSVYLLTKSTRNEETFIDTSYCFTTETGFWLSRRNGKILPTGNSGKSRVFLNASRDYITLVITEKSAISGVKSEAKEIGVDVDVINYQSVHKFNPMAYNLIICDECHRFISQAKPKPAVVWKEVVKFTKGKKLILASATPTSEGFSGLYYQLGLSSYSPFKHPRFTKFFEEYGTNKKIFTGIRLVPDYKACNVEKVQKNMEHLVVSLTRKATGHTHESKDVIHEIPLSKKQQKIYNTLKDDKLWVKGDIEILADTGVKMLGKLHQVSGGIAIKGETDNH